MNVNNKILSDITVHMKYAKFIPELNRRETWEELVTRNKEMHQKKYPDLYNEIQRRKEEEKNTPWYQEEMRRKKFERRMYEQQLRNQRR